MKNYVNYLCLLLMLFLSLHIKAQIDLNPLEVNKPFDFELLLNDDKAYCKVPSIPTSFDLKNSGEIEKLTNIGNAENINVNNKNGVFLVYNFIFEYDKNMDLLYSPQKSEKFYRENIENIIGKNIREEFSLLKKDLREEIAVWKTILTEFITKLEASTLTQEKKQEAYNFMIKYKDNIDTSDCLVEDYIDDVIIKTDNDGNKSYLFDIEKIKNDPNYFFIGKESEGFIVAKKFNKFGYLSKNKKVYLDIPFKYNYCVPFKNEYGIAKDYNYTYIINKRGKEILKYFNTDVDSIQVLRNNYFILYKNDYRNKNLSYIINNKGVIQSDMYHKIEAIDNSNLIFNAKKDITINSKNSNETNGYKLQYNNLIYSNHIIGFNGKVVNFGTCKSVLKFCNSKKIRKCNASVLDYIGIPNTNNIILTYKVENLQYRYLIVKDLLVNKKLRCVKITTYDGTIENYLNSYNEKENDIIFSFRELFDSRIQSINIKYNYTFENSNKMFDSISRVNNSRNLNTIGFVEKLRTFYSFKYGYIGEPCDYTLEIIPNKKLLVFGNDLYYKTEKSIGYGVMNYFGQYIIPPIFNEVFYNGKNFIVSDFRKHKYKIDDKGTCLGLCDEYRKIVKRYFNFVK